MNESPEFHEGYRAFDENKSLSDNPYVKGSQSYEQWACGFGSAWSEEISANNP